MNDNLPKSPDTPDPLDALLREAEPHLPDDGFTARVLTSLPPRRRFDWLRLALFTAAWLAGAAILFLHAPAFGGAATAFAEHARHGDMASLLMLAPVMFAMGALVWALVCWALEEWA